MWWAITSAVQSGWGATMRLLAVLALLGLLLIVATVAAGDSVFVIVLKELLARTR
jgi:hypothetical protein